MFLFCVVLILVIIKYTYFTRQMNVLESINIALFDCKTVM